MIINKDDCECGLDEKGDWSDEVFDRYGCDCESTNKEDDRKCFNCGDTAYPETGFIFQDELYCEDCCPEEYGE